MNKKIAILSGDGIGPEVMDEAVKVLDKVAQEFGHEFEYKEAFIGGAAWDECGEHLPKETLKICEESDAVLFGSVGGPVDKQMEEKWNGCEKTSVLGLRKHFEFGINLRPSKVYSQLKEQCCLKAEIVDKGIDILCVRELVGGIYFGDHSTEVFNNVRVATDVMIYDEETIRAAAKAAFKMAMKRGKKLVSIDKANVLDCSKLWRSVVEEVAKDYPEVSFEHMLVDNCAMQIVSRPYDFDVILLPNMFGDIISDEASVFAGSLGMLPSASLNKDGFGMYEPSGGSAPDIAGKGIANPIAQILSGAMMLKYSFGMNEEHDAIVNSLENVLSEGIRTGDIAGKTDDVVKTSEMGDAIVKFIKK